MPLMNHNCCYRHLLSSERMTLNADELWHLRGIPDTSAQNSLCDIIHLLLFCMLAIPFANSCLFELNLLITHFQDSLVT